MNSTDDAVDASPGNGTCATAAPTRCTLRAAIQESNALPGPDAITLPAGTYEIAIPPLNQNLAGNGDLDITDSLAITGAGQAATIVDGGTPRAGAPIQAHGLDRLFEVSADGATVAFSDLTLREGWADEYGGALMNSSSAAISVIRTTVTRSGAGKTGGGIDNHFAGSLEVLDSTLSDNYASEAGSALNNNRGGELVIHDTDVSSNSAADAGLDESLLGAGAIANNAELDAVGSMVVTDSRIVDNRAGSGRNGAGISNDGAGTVLVTDTVFDDNRAVGDGGALFNANGVVTVTRGMFTDNAGNNGGAISSSGSGLIEVIDGTFTTNLAADWGGAMHNGNSGSATVRSSTFTENIGLNGGGLANEGSGLVTIESSAFTKNQAVDTATAVGGEGGGMHSNSGGEVVVTGGSFVENRALSGGGFSNEGGGSVVMTGTRVASNFATEAGGGILVQSGAVRMIGIDVVGNVSDSPLEGGGGISYAGDKVVSTEESAAVESSRIRDNTSKGDGGGIDSRGDGPLVITTTSITGNSALIGGAIHHVGDATLEVDRSTLSGNAAENGGGVFSDGDGEATIVNSTLSSNRASQFGGGLLVSSRVVVRNSTLSANSAAFGGGVNNGGGDLVGDGSVFLANTIVAGNAAGGNCAGTMTSRGGNVENTSTCQLHELNDQPGTDPLLGPLASNGGPTQTHALLPGSPAQESAACTELDPCPPLDQRGITRPAFIGVDAGAYESETTPGGGGEQVCAGRSERPVPADFDSWVSESSPVSNRGTDAILDVTSQSSANERALVHFALPPMPPGCKLVGATLRLWASAATAGRTLEARRLTGSWTELGVNWSSQPSAAGPAATTESALGLLEWNVLAQAEEMYASGAHGFVIRDAVESNAGGSQSFHSREKGEDHPPELVLVFEDPDASPSSGACPTTPQLFFADRDSWVSEGSPTNNFGQDSTLKVKSQIGSNSRVLLRFPLPTLPGGCTTVTSATLRLDASSVKEGRSFALRRAGSAWTEAGVTWASQPARVGPALVVPVAPDLLELNVTEQVLGSYVDANHGFVLADAEEDGVGDEQTISSRDKINDGAPELVLVLGNKTPDTTLGPAPSSPTEERSASFTFSSESADATFECSLDGAAYAACTSPHGVTGLSEGGHRLDVRAKRPVRAIDPTPASATWVVAIPPETTLAGPSSPSASADATLTFSADDPDATFECSLDGGAWTECDSPLELTDLADGERTVRVRGTDALGNVESEPAVHTWTVAVPPDTTIEGGPSALSNSASATFEFSAVDNGPADEVEFACSLDDSDAAACTSVVVYDGLADGVHAFSVRATDAAGNEEAEATVFTWTVDTTVPQTELELGPDALTQATSASFAFSSNEDGSTFTCSLDDASASCESPATYDSLADGEHTFSVSATDPAGNEDATAASFAWAVDTTPPETSIDSAPEELTNLSSAEFAFTANEDGTTFACSLDGAAYAACGTGASYADLADGEHTFAVLATDAAGNEEAEAATHVWVVDTVAPDTTIESAPDALTRSTSASFAFGSSEDGSTFACSLDGATYSSCESPAPYDALEEGEHTFEVLATDPAGNADDMAARFAWTIDATPPETSVADGPPALTNVSSATFAFASNEEGSTFACALDGGDFSPCESGASYADLADGEHTFAVRAIDAAGNTDSTTAEHTWVVDMTPPETSIASGPEELTNDPSASIAFAANENGATFSCSLDGAAFAGCESPAEYAGLGDGEHVFLVRATDAAGNDETAAAIFLWTIDTTAPETSIASGPPALTNASSAGFGFTSTEEGSTFACSLDAGEYAACDSGAAYTGLDPGEHTFAVRATDPAGNTSASAASHTWTIDTEPPDTGIATGPAALSSSSAASFSLTSTEAGSTFACALDGSAFSACPNPASYEGLADGEHTFEVLATDPAGNMDATAASRTWTVDTTAPETSIDEGPPALTNITSASFAFASSESGSTFACSLDGAAFAACESPQAYADLADGEHVFMVRATDRAGNADDSAATFAWTVDTIAPETSISAGPPAQTSSTSASIEFTSSEEGSGFACSLDGVPLSPCGSPASYVDLDEGAHIFAVVATDAAGNADPTAATSSWTVDVTAPDTSITLSPPALSASADASFSFTSSEDGSSFVCSLDEAAFATCESPVAHTGLGDGEHTFAVQATDAAGNPDPTAATRSWTIDTTAPDTSLTASPPAFSNSASATFSFASSEGGSSFACSLDGAEYAACASGASYPALADGEHTFAVRATDAAGNADESAASHSWTVDTVEPQTTITDGPPELTNSAAATLRFASSDAGSTFACSLDGEVLSPCTSPVSYAGLGDGAHTFAARATDAAGNADSSPATRTWTVDTSAPETAITAAPPTLSGSASASFELSSTTEDATFACSLDGAAFSACESPQGYTGLADGEHTFAVRASDPAGNADASPATHTWTVDTTPPQTSITGSPPAVETSQDATFTFASSETGSSFECSLDGAALSSCVSPASYSGLADGEHSFSVVATDAAGNVDPTAATAGWTVDTSSPDTSITDGPPALTTSTSASFFFDSTQTGATFACSLDAGAFAACTSPQTYSALLDGPHTFAVRATDSAGNADQSPATRAWTIDTIAPDTTITLGPPATTTSTSASFELSATEAGSTFACSLDNAAFAACTSPHQISELGQGPHQLRVRATDAAGNADGTPASHSWTVQAADTTAPETTITAGPTGPTNDATPTFEFTAGEAATYHCRVDAASFAPCSSPHTTSTLGQGAHTFQVRATDSAGNVDQSAASRTFSVDTAAPQTTITAGPPASTPSTTARFEFTSTEQGSLFECSLDGSGFAPCFSPVTYTVGSGSHEFQVRARDAAGNVDGSPATSSWTVQAGDTTPPETSITGGPNGATNDSTPTFTFSSSESGSTFQCRVDSASFASCSSPHTTSTLAQGAHTWEVRATDAAGNVDQTPALRNIVVDTAAPNTTVTAGPTGPTNDTTPTFEFTATETATFQCRVDTAAYATCSSPHTTASVGTGSHTFQVRAVDSAGNVDGSPASRAFSIDTTAPNTTITQAPPATTQSATVSFQFTGSETGSSFECSLDGSGFAPCSPPVTHTVSPGSHQFQVRARDVAGNTDGSPASASWTYQAADTIPPETTITNGPPETTQNATVSFEFTSSETGSSFTCSLDGAGFAPCSSPVTYTVSVGSHEFQVRATDAAGNVDGSPASRSWTREEPPPGSCTPSTVTLAASADSWVLQSSSSSNYGSDSVLKVDSKLGAVARALVRFSLPALPAGCQILDAELRLYAGSYKTGRTIDVYALTSAWGETSVTWGNQPVPAGSASGVASGSGYREWNVTAQLASTYAANTGFLVRDRTDDRDGFEQGFHSREKGADNPPQLVVTFG